MKLLQINAVYGYGSTGMIVKDLHEMCVQEGIESHVAYSTAPGLTACVENGYVIGHALGKKLHALLCRINGKQAYFSTLATRKLLKHIEELSPDIVHLHNLHSNYIHLNMLLQFLAEKEIATVITLHDCWFYTGGCFHYTEAECFKWTAVCGNCPKKRSDTPAYCFDFSKRIQADRRRYFSKIKNLTAVGVSDWIADEAGKTFLGGADIRRIYNGIDLAFFKPTPSDIRRQLEIEEEAFVVLGMANKWLLPGNRAALEHVSAQLPQDAVMLLVGCSEKQRKKLPVNVRGIGYVSDRETMRKIYSTADVFINCTREETLSLVNVEAQACGTPIITYCNTGAKETVDEQSGFSVKDGDYRALTDKLLELIPTCSQSAERKCSAFISGRFDMKKNYREYMDLYYEICGNHPK